MNISDHDMNQFDDLFAPVLDWLDVDVYTNNPKVGFNMGRYNDEIGAQDFREIECKQTVCVLGYLWKYHGFQSQRDYGSAIIDDLIERFDFEDVDTVRKVLNRISMVEGKNGESLVDDLEDIQPYQVAAVIRYFLRTRKIKWEKFLTKDKKKDFTEDYEIFYD